MNMMFYLGAIGLGLAPFFFRNTSPYSRSGGSEYEKKRLRRMIGIVVLVMAGLLLMFALAGEFAKANL
jgi:hypothetical protein